MVHTECGSKFQGSGMGSFDEATAVRRIGDGRYSAELDAAYGFEQALNGGYLMAVLARAALHPAARPHPVSPAASFLRVGRPGPAEVHVETRKSGRTTEVARVTLVQEDLPVVEAIITSGTLDGDAEPLYPARGGGPRPPRGGGAGPPPLEECVLFGNEQPESGFAAQVEMRYDADTMGWLDGQPTGRPEMRSHFRLC